MTEISVTGPQVCYLASVISSERVN